MTEKTEADNKAEPRKCIAAILAHSDDLEINCGGTFAKCIAEGYEGVYGVLSLCNSGYTWIDRKPEYRPSSEVIPMRDSEAKAAAEVFGAELFKLDLLENNFTDSEGNRVPLTFPYKGYQGEDPPKGGLPLSTAAFGMSMPGRKSAVETVADLFVRKRPSIVICQTIDNGNPDHFAAALIVYKAHALASQAVQLGPCYMPLSEIKMIPAEPDWVVDVTGHEETACRAISCHVSQGGEHRVEGLWRKWKERGKKHGVMSAELFVKLR